MSENTEKMGGWSPLHFTITTEETSVFNEALEGFCGVSYTPLAVATQVVAGINYCFLCKAVIVYPGASETLAKVYIYQPLDGKAHITEIIRINL